MDDINLEAALSRMDGPPGIPREACFPLGRRLHTQRRKDLLKVAHRRAARQFIKPENADDIVAALPAEEGDSTHGIIPGDFVFCDLLPRLVAKHGCPPRIDITTLSMSEGNVHTLLGLLNHPAEPAVTLLASVYFWETNTTIARAVETMLVPHPRFRCAVGRQHTKIMLLDYPDRVWVIEGSANLRSSNCIEQITITAAREVLEFHRSWIMEFHERAAVQTPAATVPCL